MSWARKVQITANNETELATEINAVLTSAGWTLYDDETASKYKVWKTQGESGTRFPAYLRVDWGTAAKVYLNPFSYWNAATNVGQGFNTKNASTEITAASSAFNAWIYANKDGLFVFTKVGATYYYGSGFYYEPFLTNTVTLSAGIGAGSDVVASVTGSTAWIPPNSYWQIQGVGGEGRDRIQITAKTASTVTIASVPRAYNAGAYIGHFPCHFLTYSGGYAAPASLYNTVGTADNTTVISVTDLLAAAVLDPDALSNLTMPFPFYFSQSNQALYGFAPGVYGILFACPTTGLTSDDVLGYGYLDNGTSTGGNTSTTLNDTAKAWGVNAHQNKAVICKAGTGQGQMGKIASNTATQLVIEAAYPWVTIPDATTQYEIVEEGYRYFYAASKGLAVREVL